MNLTVCSSLYSYLYYMVHFSLRILAWAFWSNSPIIDCVGMVSINVEERPKTVASMKKTCSPFTQIHFLLFLFFYIPMKKTLVFSLLAFATTAVFAFRDDPPRATAGSMIGIQRQKFSQVATPITHPGDSMTKLRIQPTAAKNTVAAPPRSSFFLRFMSRVTSKVIPRFLLSSKEGGGEENACFPTAMIQAILLIGIWEILGANQPWLWGRWKNLHLWS